MISNIHIIGTRTITNAAGGSVEITIHLPKADAHGSFYCEFSLNGLSWTGKIRRAYGIDAIQALYLALQSVGADLDALRQVEGLDLKWIGESCAGDLGLPSLKV